MVEGPLPAGVVDAGDAASIANCVYVRLESGGHVVPVDRFDEAVDSDSANVYRDDVAAVCRNRDLLPRNHQGGVRAAVPVAVVEEEEVVVFRQYEKVVAVVLVPRGYEFRLRVAVGLGRVSVKVAPEPGLFCHLNRLHAGKLFSQHGKDAGEGVSIGA